MIPPASAHRLLVLFLLLFALAGLPAAVQAQPPAQEQEVIAPDAPQASEIVLELDGRSHPRLRLALPAATRSAGAAPPAREAMDEFERTLRADLEFTGVFRIHGPEVFSVLTLTGEREHDFVQYASLDNEVVIVVQLTQEGDRIVVEGRGFDLPQGRYLFGKRYQGTYDLSRRMAHIFSDEILAFLTSLRGVARTQISFSSDRDGDRNKEIYMMDYDGANQRRVTAHESLTLAPTWSPTNDVLAYISYFEGGPSIYAADIQTGRKSSILVDHPSVFSPTFSPDGQDLAFTQSVDGNMEIFRCTRSPTTNQCSKPIRLTHSGGIDTNPAWSPNGREIAFTSSRGGDPQIYVMDAEGTNARRLSFDGKYNEGASWHPKGTKITFSHRDESGKRFDIAILDLTTLEMKIITDGLTGSHEAPSFSPDGRFVAFESTRVGGRQIFIMPTAGGEIRQITSRGNNFGPAWSNYLE